MLHADLPLFAWRPQRVLLFPLSKRVAKVRRTAEKLLSKGGYDAELYWKQIVASNRKHLERLGLSEDEIEFELRSFFDAVQAELTRMAYASRGHPGGAA